MSKYLLFREVRDTGKTKVYSVTSLRSGQRLGLIHWYGPWRQYTLAPADDTIWNKDCLREIATFLEQRMIERRKSPATAPLESGAA